jgi:hypothetical protein
MLAINGGKDVSETGKPTQPSIFGGKPDYPGTLFNVDLMI